MGAFNTVEVRDGRACVPCGSSVARVQFKFGDTQKRLVLVKLDPLQDCALDP